MGDRAGHLQSIDSPGIRAEGDLLYNLRREVAQLLHRDKIDFPGAQPVSFAKKHMEELRNEDYFVCEKSDGIRYLLYITDDGNGGEATYMIDRKNEYWWVQGAHFPTPNGDETFHPNTILDGELVMDRLPNGKEEPVYLVFDCLVLDKMNLMGRDLSKRLGYFIESVMKPYKNLFNRFPEERQYQPFILGAKEMEKAYGVDKMFGQIIKNLRHGNDGLIFTCLKTEYKHGTDPHILKWKPADENTVDFQWKLHFPTVQPSNADRANGITKPFADYDSVPKVELLVYEGRSTAEPYRHFGELYLPESEWEELKALGEPLDERVVEAWMDDRKRWRFYRFRDDKNHGNHHTVVSSVLNSIQDGIGKDELIAACPQIRQNWKRREQQVMHQQQQARQKA